MLDLLPGNLFNFCFHESFNFISVPVLFKHKPAHGHESYFYLWHVDGYCFNLMQSLWFTGHNSHLQEIWVVLQIIHGFCCCLPLYLDPFTADTICDFRLMLVLCYYKKEKKKKHTYKCKRMHAHSYTCTHIHQHTHTHTHTHTPTHTLTHIHQHTHTQPHTRARTNTHSHTPTHPHTGNTATSSAVPETEG